jgi:hypothetical protein
LVSENVYFVSFEAGNVAPAKGFFSPLASHVLKVGAGLTLPKCGLIYWLKVEFTIRAQ